MKRLNISLLVIACLFVLFGCNKSNNIDNDLYLLGVNTKDIDKIEIIHGNIIAYPDKKQSDNLTLIEDLNTAFINTGDRMVTLDEKLGITLAKAEGYAQNDSENYFVYITFLNPQTLILKNSSFENISNCDGVLFDINNLKLHWSKDGNFEGAVGYIDNYTSVEKIFLTFLEQLKIYL